MTTTATTPSELLTVIDSTIRNQTAPNSITPTTHSDLLYNMVEVLSGTTYTGNTSGDCISDIYVSNIHSCSPINFYEGETKIAEFNSTDGFVLEANVPIKLGEGSNILDYNGQQIISEDGTIEKYNSGIYGDSKFSDSFTQNLTYRTEYTGTTTGGTIFRHVNELQPIDPNANGIFRHVNELQPIDPNSGEAYHDYKIIDSFNILNDNNLIYSKTISGSSTGVTGTTKFETLYDIESGLKSDIFYSVVGNTSNPLYQSWVGRGSKPCRPCDDCHEGENCENGCCVAVFSMYNEFFREDGNNIYEETAIGNNILTFENGISTTGLTGTTKFRTQYNYETGTEVRSVIGDNNLPLYQSWVGRGSKPCRPCDDCHEGENCENGCCVAVFSMYNEFFREDGNNIYEELIPSVNKIITERGISTTGVTGTTVFAEKYDFVSGLRTTSFNNGLVDYRVTNGPLECYDLDGNQVPCGNNSLTTYRYDKQNIGNIFSEVYDFENGIIEINSRSVECTDLEGNVIPCGDANITYRSTFNNDTLVKSDTISGQTTATTATTVFEHVYDLTGGSYTTKVDGIVISEISSSGFSATTFYGDGSNLTGISGGGGDTYWTAGTGTNSIISKNQGHSTTGADSFIGGGKNNTVSGYYSAVIGGKNNTASSYGSVVVGGYSNSATTTYTIATGGRTNLVSGSDSAVIGGQSNTASGTESGIIGGNSNLASGNISFIGGGVRNTVSNNYSAVIGGRNNVASGLGSSVVGGGYYAGYPTTYGNTASGLNSFIAGGSKNLVSGGDSSVIGGYGNQVYGGNSSTMASRIGVVNGHFSSIIASYYSYLYGNGSSIINCNNCTNNGNNSTMIGLVGITRSDNNRVYVPDLEIGYQKSIIYALNTGATSSNNTAGVATLVGGTKVVNCTNITSDSIVMLTAQNSSGTPGEVYVSARGATTFTITSTSGTDTRDIGWFIINTRTNN